MIANNAKEVIELRQYLMGKYRGRNEAYAKLRQFYNADYWAGKEVSGIKLVYNLMAMAVDRYTDFLSMPPDWQVLPTDLTDQALELADRQEKLLYSQWELNNIQTIQQWQANLQSLLGFFCFEVRPFFGSKEKYVHVDVSVPEYVYPMPKSDNINDLEAVVVVGLDYNDNAKTLFQPETTFAAKEIDANVTKYYDNNKIIVLKKKEEVLRIEHNFGFIPMVCGQNRVKPHFVEGIGDMDQSVGLNQYLNELLSWEADILAYAANPITLLKGYSGDINKLPTGPGAVWPLAQDGNAQFLSWAGQPPSVENMFRRIQQAIEDGTINGDVTFGRNVPSGTSGSAVRSLMSGIQAAFLRKQVGMGNAYVRVNEIIFKFMEKMFAEKELVVRGTKKGSFFVTKMKGKEINGNYRNRCIWPPSILDEPSRVDTEMVKMNAKLQSRYTTMEKIGILSPLDEMKRIKMELEEELAMQNRANNPMAQFGIDDKQAGEFSTAARQLGIGNGSGAQDPAQLLIQTIKQIQNVRDAVFFGGKQGDEFVIVLESLNDKATIVNKLPEQFKGKVKFRKFVTGQDDNLPAITEGSNAQAVA